MPTNPLLQSPASEILDYLARHPDAQDTIEGILQWWVLEACIRKWSPVIAETVAQLVEGGLIEAQTSPSGPVFYRAAPAYRRALEESAGRPRPSS